MDIELLRNLLIIAIMLAVVTTAFVQKTKVLFKTSNFIELYSFVVNVAFSVAFCLSFTDVSIINSLWVGLFAFLGADTLYKTFEGKLQSFSDMIKPKEELKEPEVELPR